MNNPIAQGCYRLNQLFSRIPHSLIALMGRMCVAGVFWRSGQTKVDGFKLDPLLGEFHLGWPSLSDSALMLFRFEYHVPFLPPIWAAWLASVAEHVFPALLVLGLATRLSALGLLCVTLVIQLFVYPESWMTHGLWTTILLYLMAKGPGVVSLDELLHRRCGC